MPKHARHSACNCYTPRMVSCRNRGLHHFPYGAPIETEDLVLAMNPLVALNQTHLSRLTSLRHLDISGCSIKYLAPDTFSALENLVSLQLQVNLRVIPTGLFRSLLLNLDGNRLTSIQTHAFGDLIKLEQLTLDRNFLSNLSRSWANLNSYQSATTD